MLNHNQTIGRRTPSIITPSSSFQDISELREEQDFEILTTGTNVSSTKLHFKIIVLGDCECGKTNLINRYISNSFSRKHQPTVIESYSTNVSSQGQDFHIELWELSSLKNYDELRPLSYSNVDLFFLCFDISKPSSLESIKKKWIPEIVKYNTSNSGDISFLIVGCKSDLRRRTISSRLSLNPQQHTMMMMKELDQDSVSGSLDSLSSYGGGTNGSPSKSTTNSNSSSSSMTSTSAGRGGHHHHHHGGSMINMTYSSPLSSSSGREQQHDSRRDSRISISSSNSQNSMSASQSSSSTASKSFKFKRNIGSVLLSAMGRSSSKAQLVDSTTPQSPTGTPQQQQSNLNTSVNSTTTTNSVSSSGNSSSAGRSGFVLDISDIELSLPNGASDSGGTTSRSSRSRGKSTTTRSRSMPTDDWKDYIDYRKSVAGGAGGGMDENLSLKTPRETIMEQDYFDQLSSPRDDSIADGCVTFVEARKFANKVGACCYIECSAKTTLDFKSVINEGFTQFLENRTKRKKSCLIM